MIRLQNPTPSEHHVFIVRAWRVSPDAPWEYVLHHSGTDQVEYAHSQQELLVVLNEQLQSKEPPAPQQQVAA